MRRLITGLAAVALSVLMSGCFASETLLLDSRAAAQPIHPGDYGRTGRQYRVDFDRGSGYRFRTYGPDGKLPNNFGQWMFMNRWPELDRGESRAYGFAVQYEHGYGYGVMVIDKLDRVSLVTPDCGDRDDRAIAEAAGGTYEKTSSGKGCRFTDAAQLRAALGRIVAERGDYLGQPYRPY